MKIDFQIKQAPPKGFGGLTMVLVPGLPEDEAAKVAAIGIGETAFGFIEPCIREHWPAYAGYAHWGITPIPVDAWRKIVAATLALRERLLAEDDPRVVGGVGFIFADARTAFYDDFEQTRRGIVQMIDGLAAWLESKFDSCSHVSVFGI